MYKVYSDNYLLYADNLDKFTIISPKLELELNKAGKFTFEIYPNHPYFGIIKKMKSIIRVEQDNEIIFRGRVLDSEQGWYNQLKITCEGELAFLNDSIIRPYDYQSAGTQISIQALFTKFIDSHNSQVDEEKRFTIGRITVEDGDTSNDLNLISRANSDYSTTWEAVTKKLIESLGGYLIVKHEDGQNIIEYLKEIDILSSQSVEFGKNLLDITQTVSGDEMVTGIIPLGVQNEETKKRLTIESVNDGKDYLINTEQAKKFGLIFQTIIWDDVTIAENLKSKAEAYLSSIGVLTNTITINAVDISPLDPTLRSFKIGTKVRVKSSHHKVEETFTIEKLSIELMKPESNKLTLGSSFKSFTEQTSSTSSAIQTIGQKVDSAEGKIINIETDITSKVSSEIEISAESILQTVSESYYTKGETDNMFSDTRTEFEQTNEEFEFRFNTFEADVNDVFSGTDAQFEEIRKYIRFEDGNIILGEEGNELTLKIQNDRISFLQSEVEVAYFSNKKLYVTDGTFLNSLNIGNFGFFPRDNGNLSLKKVGE